MTRYIDAYYAAQVINKSNTLDGKITLNI